MAAEKIPNHLRAEVGLAPELKSPNGSGSFKQEGTQGVLTHDVLRDRWGKEYPGYAWGLGGWRRYDPEAGIWNAAHELTVKRGISEVIENAKPEGIRPTAALLSSVTELARVKVAVPDELWDADPDILVCRNGVLHIPTRELRDHRPGHYATSTVPYEYDTGATTPVWNHFLDETVPDAASFLQEFAGYALTTDTSHEIAVWLYGPPGSGKSTFLAGLQAMLGARAGVLGLAEIERNRFALANIPGKTLLVSAEQPSGYIGAAHTLNALISGEPQDIERKYRDPFTVVPRAKIAWAMNDLPRISDANSGLFRRVKVVEFPEIPENERDPEIKRHIEAKESAGILNWALEGLQRLRQRGSLGIPESVQAATAHFKEVNDVPALFVEECCVRDSRERVKAQSLYDGYKDWCLNNGHRPQSSTSVSKDWKRLGFERKRPGGISYYYGLRLKQPGEM